MRKRLTIKHRRKGFSLIELLIAVIILAVLAAIMIPIVSGRTKQARLSKAATDMENIGEAEQRVAVDTGYYVRLWMLNHSPSGRDSGPGTGAFNRDGSPYSYQVRDIGPGYFDVTDLFIDPTEGDFVGPNSTVLLTRLQNNETNFNWNGPYVNWYRDSNFYSGDTEPLPDGIPDDPWGNNYLLFTREGLVREPEGQLVSTSILPVNTAGGLAVSGLDDLFYRLTLVSLGPDGLPGDGSTLPLGQGDDLVRAVGD